MQKQGLVGRNRPGAVAVAGRISREKASGSASATGERGGDYPEDPLGQIVGTVGLWSRFHTSYQQEAGSEENLGSRLAQMRIWHARAYHPSHIAALHAGTGSVPRLHSMRLLSSVRR